MNFEAQMKQLCKMVELKKGSEVKVSREFFEAFKFRYKKDTFNGVKLITK